MKFFVVLLIAYAVLVVDAATDEELWKQFQLKHGRNYKSAIEEQDRYHIFQSNLRAIEEHNLKYDTGDVSYYLGTTKFADWTNEEFKAMLTRNISKKPRAPALRYRPRLNVSLPDFIDWRQSNVVTPVQLQNCGDCWAFGSTGALEGQYALKYGQLIKMSEQNLIDCSSSYGNGGCEGGLEMYSFQYCHDFGINSEQDYPYEGVEGSCRYDSSKNLLNVDYYVPIETGNENDLQNAIATVGPVSVGINANTIYLYAGGVFNDPECTADDINHSVLGVGYGVENNIPYWLIKNSWGTDFGEDGYIKMVRNKNDQCGISSSALYPVLY